MNNTQEVDMLKLRGMTKGKGNRELVPEVQGHEPGRVGPGINPDYGHPFQKQCSLFQGEDSG